MFSVRFVCLVLAAACLLCAGFPVLAAEVDCDAAYCFTAQDFSQSSDPLTGICVTALPTGSGTLFLGNRLVQPGDILTAGQLEQMTFQPITTQSDAQATVSYLPIYENRVEPQTQMTLSIRGKEDLAPVARDSTLETYRNLSNDDTLRVSDPEGKALTYSLVRAPRRGDVELRDDGSFTYTPKKNKVGVDSFTFTAADPAGNVSREATVTIEILKPSDARQYTDTAGLDCRFEAEWLRNTGLFAGENVGGANCFYPQKDVSRGEFLTMLVELLDIPVEQVSADAPDWVQPYLDAAIRSGLVSGWQQESFSMAEPITGAEAAVTLQNALDLPAGHEEILYSEDTPVWAATSLAVMEANGLALEHSASLTRGQTAQLLYQVSRMAVGAPGMTVFAMQE
jgi:hypothetical protein